MMYFKINDFTSEELGVNPNSDYFTSMENIPPGLSLCVRCQRYCHVIMHRNTEINLTY